MNILGLIGTDSGYHPAACLLQNGRLVAFAEEERFLGIKGAFSKFPINASLYCLKEAGISLNKVDYIAFGWDAEKYRLYMPVYLFKSYLGQKLKEGRVIKRGNLGLSQGIVRLIQYRPSWIRERIAIGFKKHIHCENLPPTIFIPHHLSHAASAFYCSGFKDAIILTMDGYGEDKCTVAWVGKGLDIKPLFEFKIPNSLGWFYSMFTEYLGFIPNQDEGKLMGLAAYGKYSRELMEKINRILKVESDEGVYSFDPSYGFYGSCTQGVYYSDKLIKLLGSPRTTTEILTDRHRNIAFTVQYKIEEAIMSLVNRAVRETGIRNLCIAGGIGLNCKVNGRLLLSGIIDDLFVQPASNDSGCALGAAQVLSLRMGYDPRFSLKNAFYGPGYSNDQIKKILQNSNVKHKFYDDIAEIAADRLINGKVVAFFQGRMEMGPRALGGRSIIANPTKIYFKEFINCQIKHREIWQPLSPSILDEAKIRYLKQPYSSPFMTMANIVKEELSSNIPAVVHIDNSIRPQTVTQEDNPVFWRLINYFSQKSGVPIVLNTSFNLKGRPIVMSPASAIGCFYESGLDALVMGNYFLEK